MQPSRRLLVVDDDPFALETFREALERAGFETRAVPSGPGALHELEQSRFDLLITDIQMEPMNGFDLVGHARDVQPGLPFVMVSDAATLEAAVQALRAGALDFIAKPFGVDEVLATIDRALCREHAADDDETAIPADAEDQTAEGARAFDEMIGHNPRMQRVYQLIRTVAPATSTVLITGESGTGKERVAAAIHGQSPRSSRPMVKVNCSAFAEGVLESELFGHEQGAFTGAVKARVGVFRKAHGGTLFLDEIGDLPLSTQVKLLRVIQEKEVQPVGGDRTVPVDVRLIAATHRDLAADVKEGRFREDLYFRLNVIPVQIPALRERSDDIPHLAKYFLERFARQCSQQEVRGFSERALTLMERYSWPGNVRELENAVERAVVLASNEVIDTQDLPPELRGTASNADGSFQLNTVKLSEVEEIVVRRVLTRTSWNIKRSAEILGITRATLYSKIRKFGLAIAR